MKFFVFIASSIFILFSCQKEKLEKKLMNKWKYISVTKPVIFQPTTYWSFNESTVFVTDSATADTVLFGDYFLKNNMMVISGASTTMKGGELFKGNFQVLELKDSTLILVRKEYIPDTINDGLIYHEFVKAN